MQFRTKARAVDLLGKGQIADLPTAITELWKNGFDAYADNLTAEIFLPGYKNLGNPLFMITDDGKGMSRSDIFEKWLVLGTDSKSRVKNKDIEGEETLFKKPRTKAGEKGIGRLSVAFLGSPMLMLTKKIGYPLQALFFDWRLLENFNLFLDDVEIPVTDINDTSSFRSRIEVLQNDFLENIEKENDSQIWEEDQHELKTAILNSVKDMLIPDFFEEEIISDIIDLNAHGTKFIIFEPEEQILNLLRSDIDNNDSEFVRSSLAGFTNPFKKDSLPIKTSFPIHKKIGSDYDFLTSQGVFFEPKDFELADILISGEFDGQGRFKGILKIFDEEVNYEFVNPRKKDKRNNYGAFPLKLGYSQGRFKDSKLDEGAWNKINRKVKQYGALYIYRDDFRVLPYGRPDSDFLGFEERRSERAGTAYFSYRRMFGFVGLERSRNDKLKDKSSREGIINNAAYRLFKDDLIAFFKDLASEYFSDTAKKSLFLDKKKIFNDQDKALKQDKERTRKEKIQFSKSLKEYPAKFKEYKEHYSDLIERLRANIEKKNILYSEIENLLDEINFLDRSYIDYLPQIPKSYQPTELQLERLSKFEQEIIDFNDTIKINSQELINEVQRRLEVKDLQNEFIKNSVQYKASLETLLTNKKQQLSDKFHLLLNEYESRSENLLSDLEFSKVKTLEVINSKDDVIIGIKSLSQKFEFLRSQFSKETLPLIEHIEKLNFDIDEDLVQGAYKAEYENIKHRWEQTRETAQLGIAVEIIDHEFNILYSQINSSIERIAGNIPQSINDNFNLLKSFFKSLEDKYALLSPLYRVSGVLPKTIICNDLYLYLLSFFERKLSEEDVILKATNEFKKHQIEIKEPVIHTVLINVINNALYWLRNSSRKEILLDFRPKTDEILIINSGQKIDDRRIEKIFELFYSNRPNGRGIGLYLSKQTLQENYFDIVATNSEEYNKLGGACFIIKPMKS